MAEGPLTGLKVVELTLEIQGPYAGLTLSEMGADVIKIEARGTGDTARTTTLRSVAGADVPNGAFSDYYFVMNRGKRSLALDLKSERGKEILLKLLATADVILSNFRTGVMERLGFGYDRLSTLFPRLIYAVGSGWGPRGPKASFPGRDMLAQAASGLMGKTGEDPAPPTPTGANIADYSGGHMLVTAILAALYHRNRTGAGQRVDASLYGTMISLQPWEIMHTALTGQEMPRAGQGHPLLKGAWGAFATADSWIVLCSIGQAVWPKFCDIIGRPDLAADPHWTGYTRNIAGEAFRAEILDVFRSRTTAAWMEQLGTAGILATAAASHLDLLADPQAAANLYIRPVTNPQVGAVTVSGSVNIAGSPIEFSSATLRGADRAAGLGADTNAVLHELGYAPAEIAALRQAAVI